MSSKGRKPLGFAGGLGFRPSRRVAGTVDVDVAEKGRFWPAAMLLLLPEWVRGVDASRFSRAEASRWSRRALALRRLIS